jgi:pimeloyl-ACP methyl ester carboxylesterase
MEMLGAPSARITNGTLAGSAPKYQRRGQEFAGAAPRSAPPPKYPAEMPHAVASDGTRIAYDVTGSGAPLLLLHGITEAREQWDPIVERLAPDFTCVRVDVRGHGESEPARTDHDVFKMADDVAAVVEAAAVDTPIVVGHSMGGLIATVRAASDEPVRGVVNVDQSLRLADLAGVVRSLEDELRGPELNAVMVSFMDALGVDALPPATAERVRGYSRTVRPEIVLDVWGPLFTATDAELEALAETELLAKVDVPYLALHGSEPGTDYRAWLTGLMPTAAVEVWEGDGHWLHLVEPDRFAGRVREFAAGI